VYTVWSAEALGENYFRRMGRQHLGATRSIMYATTPTNLRPLNVRGQVTVG